MLKEVPHATWFLTPPEAIIFLCDDTLKYNSISQNTPNRVLLLQSYIMLHQCLHLPSNTNIVMCERFVRDL
jgi:hypothetical protein